MTNVNSLNQAAPATPATVGQEVDLGTIVSQVRRFRWLLSLAVLLGLIIGALVYFTSTRKFTADTTLMINLEGEAAAQQSADITQALSQSSIDPIAPALAIAKSTALLELVADEALLVDDPEFNEDLRDPSVQRRAVSTLRPAIDAFKDFVGAPQSAASETAEWAQPEVLQRRRSVRALEERVTVTDLQDNLQLQIAVTTESPEKSARLANMLAVELNSFMLDTKVSAIDNARKWITDEADRVEGNLREIEAEINKQISAGSVISDDTSLGQNAERLVGSELILEANRLRIDALVRLGEAIIRLRAGQDPQSVFSSFPENLRNELVTDYPSVFAWERRDEPPSQSELLSAEAQVERDRENQIAATARLEQEVSPIRAYTRKLSTAQNLFRQLQTNYQANTDLLATLRERLAELQIELAGEVRRLTVLETAKPPLRHATPSLLLSLLTGALIGLALGIGIILTKFLRRDAFLSLEDVEHTFGAPTVSVVSDIGKRLRSRFAWGGLSTEVAEAYRRAYSAIFVVNSDENPHSLMVTSSIPSEGKTTTSIYIAAAAAEEGRKTLLIDLDFRKKSVSRYLRLDREHGVYSVFRGEMSLKEAALPFEPGKFDILTTDGRQKAGTFGEDGEAMGRETLSAVKVRELIDEAKEHYDVIVVDVPPLLAVQDANMIGGLVDSTIFVVATQNIKKKAAQRAMKEWKRSGQPITGLIVRGEKSELHEYYGYDYYHYNYATKEDGRARRTTQRRKKRRPVQPAQKASGLRD